MINRILNAIDKTADIIDTVSSLIGSGGNSSSLLKSDDVSLPESKYLVYNHTIPEHKRQFCISCADPYNQYKMYLRRRTRIVK